LFTKFKDNKGNFNAFVLINDEQGMLRLNESAHLRVHGEDIVLDEALVFPATHLESVASHFSLPIAAQLRVHLSLRFQNVRFEKSDF
jgi:hypothetical protein